MGKTKLKAPCSKPTNTDIVKEENCWQIECNNGQTIVALNINYVSYNKDFVGLIDVMDILTKEFFLIPVNSISIIKRAKLISAKFYCTSENKTNKETNKYICHYTIPHHNEYEFDEYGQNPISWDNIS